MKIKFIGTGNTSAKSRALTSFLINDEVLFDMGGGITRRLQELGVTETAVKTLIISHFHADHASDLAVWLMRRRFITNNSEKLTVVAPRGGRQQIINIVRMFMGDIIIEAGDENGQSVNMEVIELTNDSVQLGDMEIIAHDVKHTPNTICNGYTVNIGGKTLGLSGDAGACEGLDKIVEASDMALLDANAVAAHPMHLGVEGVVEYAKKYQAKKFGLVHRADYDVADLPKNVFMPGDGDEVEL
jgi:ribonuclease BN (tRNA processing enzyme)